MSDESNNKKTPEAIKSVACASSPDVNETARPRAVDWKTVFASSHSGAVFLSLNQSRYKRIIKIRGGPYGVLMALYFHSCECCDRDGWMTIAEIHARGDPYCDSQLKPQEQPRLLDSHPFSAWESSAQRLENHRLVDRRKHSTEDRKDLLCLTRHGQKFVEELFGSRASDIVNRNKSPDGTGQNRDGKDVIKAQEILSSKMKKKASAMVSVDREPAATSTSITSPQVKPTLPKKKPPPPPPPPPTTTTKSNSDTPKKRKQPSIESFFKAAKVTPPCKRAKESIG